jgi:hypothetical protein
VVVPTGIGIRDLVPGLEELLSRLEQETIHRAAEFFDDLLASSLPLSKVVYGALPAWWLRERVSKDPVVLGEHYTILFSGPMIRVLAGVRHELLEPSEPKKGETKPEPLSGEELGDFFLKLDALMELDGPFTPDSIWIKGLPARVRGGRHGAQLAHGHAPPARRP